MSKRIVCPCEDLTDRDIERATDVAGLDLEAVKRFCGVATGPCQGKQCLLATQQLLRELGAAEPGTIVHRPPVNPLPLGLLAGEVER
ncbi:MAG: (2Fe-2S)-binding protein [Halobacteriales archaeon]|nr:(2Fe-2S)-binding protein [Halobacteriales archaeon]